MAETPKPKLKDLDAIKSSKMFRIEAANGGRDIRLILRDLYAQSQSTPQVAKQLGLSIPTVYSWYEQLGLRIHNELVIETPATPGAGR